MEKRLLTVPEVMEVLALGRFKVYDLIRSGELQSVKIGRCRRVPTGAVDEMVARFRDDAA